MQVEQATWQDGRTWRMGETQREAPSELPDAHLVFVFGARALLSSPEPLALLRARYPKARLIGCSTSGEIAGTRVMDGTIVATAVRFATTTVRVAVHEVDGDDVGEDAGAALASALAGSELRHVFVLSDGLHVNGTMLVKGLQGALPPSVAITGGLAGDGDRFEETLVLIDERRTRRSVAALGLYGDALRVGCGSVGGWDAFGPERLVTRARGNVLYEVDGQSALALYKKYLGPHAAGLPASGLLFPLALRAEGGQAGLVRTILGVDDAAQSLTFAGDVPEGSYVRLMRANFDRLVDGAVGAAKSCHEALGGQPVEVALLISCVGRKLVLKQRIEEEVEAVREVLGPAPVLAGFYSYGEISPATPSARCEFHNQTMTITTLTER